MKTTFITLSLLVSLLLPGLSQATTQQPEIPSYILQGLADYQNKGYEAAVTTWLTGSPFAHGTALATRITFFKNIEMLYGRYQGYDIVFVQQTSTSSRVYIRLNFARTSGYVLFTSIPKNQNWVLAKIDLDRQQKYGSTVRP